MDNSRMLFDFGEIFMDMLGLHRRIPEMSKAEIQQQYFAIIEKFANKLDQNSPGITGILIKAQKEAEKFLESLETF